MKIAAACYPLDWIGGYYGLVEKYDAWVGQAAEQGATLLVFPENAALELAGFEGRSVAADPAGSRAAVSAMLPVYWDMCATLAHRYNVHILAGSGPCREGTAWVNRSMFLTPAGARHPHDKQCLPSRDDGATGQGRGPASPLTVMDTALGRVGVLIGTDVETPVFVRALVAVGAEIVLVPTQAATAEEHAAVRAGARACARDGPCIAVQAVTHGHAPWTPSVAGNAGAPGIYAPADDGSPAHGIVAQADENRPGWTIGTVDLARVRALRAAVSARRRTDPGRRRAPAPIVQTVQLA